MSTTPASSWLQQSIIVLKGVGDKILERFAKRSLYTLNDLLFHLPIRYQDKTRIVPIARLRVGNDALVFAQIIRCQVLNHRRSVLACDIDDGSGVLSLKFFHFNQQQVRSFHQSIQQGKWIKCFGEIKYGRQAFEIIHPEYQITAATEIPKLADTLTPIYSTTEGLSQSCVRKAIEQVIRYLQQSSTKPLEEYLEDHLPLSMREELQLPSLLDALLYLHAPPADCPVFELIKGQEPYRQRLVLEELIAHQLSMKKIYLEQQQHHAYSMNRPLLDEKMQYSAQFLQQLPFKLTQAQSQVVAEIVSDMKNSYPMQRLVQGDVGSGKTIVAALTALLAIEQGYQVALMAPTELLAEQLRTNFQQWFAPFEISVAWLSGKCGAKQRRESLADIASGDAQMVVGTHALFQKEVVFKQLALVIIDEQHRFGVHQRLSLLHKGKKSLDDKIVRVGSEHDYYPHQLIMTATPIPRTLAMTAYADLDCSIIDELPPGRTPIETVVLAESRREDILQRVHQACLSGRQAYWVCTLIEESESLQCQAAEKTYEAFSQRFTDLNIGLVHGQFKAEEKQTVMHDFKQAKIDLLIATTVIEVGVDVPNASLMIIENAERLGLSQLHQLRGRVGRGKQSSACVLMHASPLSKNAKSRLMTLRSTNDGFEVARKDLALRGPGEVLGTRQTGLVEMKIADIIRDQALISKANNMAQQIINDYPNAIDPIINRWVGKKMEYHHV